MRHPSFADRLLAAANTAVSSVLGSTQSVHTTPGRTTSDDSGLTVPERVESAALMRVNHVGEVCAQALYAAQALTARDVRLRKHYEAAAQEELHHLAWTQHRVAELDGRLSALNPIWYAGAFGIGLVAGRLSDRASLGFVIETEKQVEQHLAGHLERLPAADARSRAIVDRMRSDEARHAREAENAGGIRPPLPVRWLMRAAAKVMTATARYV